MLLKAPRYGARGLVAVALAGVVGCSGSSPGGGGGASTNGATCGDYFGDPAAPMELAPMLLGPNHELIDLHEGDDADLLRPQQGGHCLFMAARVRNLCPDSVEYEGKLLDASGGLVSGPDGHSPVVLVRDGDWLVPDATNGANVPNVCSCPALLEPVVDHTMQLVVTVTDSITAKVGVTQVGIVPVCRQTQPECKKLCECECGPNGAGFCPRPSDIACETSP